MTKILLIDQNGNETTTEDDAQKYICTGSSCTIPSLPPDAGLDKSECFRIFVTVE